MAGAQDGFGLGDMTSQTAARYRSARLAAGLAVALDLVADGPELVVERLQATRNAACTFGHAEFRLGRRINRSTKLHTGLLCLDAIHDVHAATLKAKPRTRRGWKSETRDQFPGAGGFYANHFAVAED